jgi:hypothetical protein
MSREAMQMALEALEADEQDMVADKDGHMVFRVDVAITALRQAIEQAEQQEPVAWINKSRNLLSWDKFYADMTPLYTAPPPRQPWVGLTAEEIWQCNTAPAGHHVECHICVAHQNVLDFAEAIEAKLKEKNKW